MNPRVYESSKHFFKMVELSRGLSSNLETIVQEVLKTNFYSVHPENVLLTMLFDENKEIRRNALIKIKASSPLELGQEKKNIR